MLVILGLLVGGILTGQNLIRAAEVRNLTNDVQRYTAAIYTFRDKYFALPGDMTNATQFWGKMNAACPTHNGTDDSNGTCNGNGDGKISLVEATDIGEHTYFWNHLAQAGLVEGRLYEMDWSPDVTMGQHVPLTVFSEASFRPAYYADQSPTSTWWYEGSYGNLFRYGKPNNGVCNSCFNRVSAITPEVAWNIDTKMDDGKPGTGRVKTSHNNISSGTTLCTDTNDSSLASTAAYDLSDSSVGCLLLFLWGG